MAQSGNLESAIEGLFRLSPSGTKRPDELVDSICRAHALDGDDRRLIETFVRELASERLPTAPTMDNATLYKAPPEILST